MAKQKKDVRVVAAVISTLIIVVAIIVAVVVSKPATEITSTSNNTVATQSAPSVGEHVSANPDTPADHEPPTEPQMNR